MDKKTRFISIAVAVSLLLVLFAAASAAIADNGAPRVTTLSGAEEVGPDGQLGAGDEDGSGFASIRLNHGQGTVCWEVSFQDIADPFAAHIHAAPAGSNGGVVVPLSPIEAGCASAERDLIKAIIQNPDQYYVNVHNSDFPGGALRGQLSNPGQSE
ncbi:MAG: CHRD domain-containing protein [Anaerolineae bacterium]|nr:CHRD domain-containing protein [Anaerolineae bacterium]